MSLKTLGEDVLLGAAGLADEFDEEIVGTQTDFAADTYSYFNPGTNEEATEASAQSVENAGGVDAVDPVALEVDKAEAAVNAAIGANLKWPIIIGLGVAFALGVWIAK